MEKTQGYWTDGAIDPKTNTVGTGTFVKGTPPDSYSRLPSEQPNFTKVETTNPKITPTKDVVAPAPFDELAARNNAIAVREAQFSNIENIFKSRIKTMVDTETEAGRKDLARANTISAMTGMAGGGDAISRAGASEKETKRIIEEKTNAINNEKMNAISGIYDRIDQNVQNEKSLSITRNEAQKRELTDKMNNAAMSNVNEFATHGVSWDKAIKDPDFQAEVKRTGKTAFEVQKLYNDSLPNNLKPKEVFSGFKGNDFVQIFQNADGTVSNHTYSAKELGIPNTIQDLGTVNMNGKIYWYDKKNPLKADGTPNLLEVGNKTDTTKNTTKYVAFTPGQKRNILSTGLKVDEIKNIEADLQKYDLNTVLEGITDVKQKEAIRSAFERGGGGA